MGALLTRATVGLTILVGFLALASTGAASVAIRPAPGTPDPRVMVLTVADLGGAHVSQQHYYKDTDFRSVISYSREFEEARVGSARFLDVDTEAEVGTGAASTAQFVRVTRKLFSSKKARARLAKEFAKEAGEGSLFSVVGVDPPRNLGAGASGSFDLLFRLKLLGARTDFHIAIFRVERVLGGIIAFGEPGSRVSLPVITRLARIMAARMGAELGPKNTALPTISGTPQSGQTLTATPGAWSASTSNFAYQWQRCDPTGASCTDVAGATGSSYVLTDADVGSTIRVAVTARSSSGAATATSAATSVVAASGAPANTSSPAITGLAQVGQTLNAGTGAWTGSPTSFSFQWQRCSAAGASCVDITGATAGAYVVSSDDRGSTLRVLVTARNGVGAATAVSSPTSVVT